MKENLKNSPPQGGLYSPEYEHDACGVGFVVHLKGDRSHEIIDSGLRVLEHMNHRGAEGADSRDGDGAGIMTQIPHEFILLHGIPVPERGKYGTGLVFLSKDPARQQRQLELIRREIAREGLTLMHVRDVPVDSSIPGPNAAATEPAIRQLFVTGDQGDRLERRLYLVRKRIEREATDGLYIVSLSTRRIVYKGMLTSLQLRDYFPDLRDPYYTSAIALVHSRFSTNTFPRWDLAQPFRMLGHNGEINTIGGNRSWMQAREPLLHSELLGPTTDFGPIIQPGMSDSASLDNALEFFVQAGMSLPHALAMMVPESFNAKNAISRELKGFYDYHSIFMEPWDGPATILFSDGRYIGGMLDRNGLRPARYLITDDDIMVVASETGVLEVDPARIRERGRFRPGKMLLVDTQEGTLRYDAQVKAALAAEHPYADWIERQRVTLGEIRSGRRVSHTVDEYDRMLRAFGYTAEDIDRMILPMTERSSEPIGSMGNDTPPAVLSEKPHRLFDYFRQKFAQVTNPPIDPLREELVMSLTGYIGAIRSDLLTPKEEHCKVVRLFNPLITNRELDILQHLEYKGFYTTRLSMLFPARSGAEGLAEALDRLCSEAERAVDEGKNYIILSDRGVSADQAPVPSLLALSAIHHHLIRRGKRAQTALIVESAEPREVMHIALLIGFGASAVCPYLAFAVLDRLVSDKRVQLDYDTAEAHYIRAIDKGLLKIISKAGISTLRSYRGARMFESIGLSAGLLERYFDSMPSPVGGISLADLATATLRAHADGFGHTATTEGNLPDEGFYLYRKGGEQHAWTPKMIAALRQAASTGSAEKYEQFAALADSPDHPIFLRNLLRFRPTNAVPLESVEPAGEIMKRFVTGAMSFGSISREAHEAIALAMNRIGGRSNTGEGGEEPSRLHSEARSAIKQVASGRFGVTAEYLVNADEIQIKVAQGAKPGEGGQLPGYKVDEMVARTRHSLPGITLISPPPHHDIYSIEDLAQLIFDLKNVNPTARVSVKLVAELGIGTVAAGVAKAKADMIVVSGGDGGTGASPVSSIRYAGMPFELGLAEVQQTLMRNGLRGTVSLQADGQLKTGRDVLVAAMLGAEEYAFSTAPLVALGCVMDRKCHSNCCPVGIATQNPAWRSKFRGSADNIVHYFTLLAEDVRRHLAALGFTRLEEVIGRSDLLEQIPAGGLDLERLLWRVDKGPARQHSSAPRTVPNPLDDEILRRSAPALDGCHPVEMSLRVANTDRSVGSRLSGEVARRYGGGGLQSGTITVNLTGSAGQSLGAFLTRGITLNLEGDANDYLGKGLSGGRIVVRPSLESHFLPQENTIAGNTLLYGATSGEVFIGGRAGERFAVRNSGATAVVEGVGDHGCEYMTGGRVVVLGPVGRNFAAGMSGGIAYVWNPAGDFDFYCNMEMIEITIPSEAAELAELRSLIADHCRLTGSPLAAQLLESWPASARQFVKVTPIEYKRFLAETAKTAEAAATIDTVSVTAAIASTATAGTETR